MIQTTVRQIGAIRGKLSRPITGSDEKLWTYLVADLLDRAADQGPYLQLLCGEAVPLSGHLDPWVEAQPISPRTGSRTGERETNARIDLAVGAIRLRPRTDCGIDFDKRAAVPFRWVCFVESKGPARDCDFSSEYDWLRNQLERCIESLLGFQAYGAFPDCLYFTLLTPRLCRTHPRSRLYGYRMEEYLRMPQLIVEDIERCPFDRRDDGIEYEYPLLHERLKLLRLTWVSYEEIFERAFGLRNLDILTPDGLAAISGSFQELAARMAQELSPIEVQTTSIGD
jgi:hypothetical protein